MIVLRHVNRQAATLCKGWYPGLLAGNTSPSAQSRDEGARP
jgi:hypothetical protein